MDLDGGSVDRVPHTICEKCARVPIGVQRSEDAAGAEWPEEIIFHDNLTIESRCGKSCPRKHVHDTLCSGVMAGTAVSNREQQARRTCDCGHPLIIKDGSVFDRDQSAFNTRANEKRPALNA